LVGAVTAMVRIQGFFLAGNGRNFFSWIAR